MTQSAMPVVEDGFRLLWGKRHGAEHSPASGRWQVETCPTYSPFLRILMSRRLIF
jgi:hypothetical protein